MSHGRPVRPPSWMAAGLATVAVLAAASCSVSVPSPVGPGEASSAASSRASPTPRSRTVHGPSAPLTGLPVASAADAARPAVALDIAGPAPQGLSSADVVFEEITTPIRYVAVFQSKSATGVGPITSTRPSDSQLLPVIHPLVGYNGGTAPFIKVLDKTRVTDVSYPRYASLYSSTPHGLTTSTQAIWRAVRGTSPPPLYQYRGEQSGGTTLAASGLSRPTSVQVIIPGGGTQHWIFGSRADRWTLASGGPRVQVANVVIQTVPYQNVYLSHRDGITVPTARVIGGGRATVLSGSTTGASGGTAASGTWSKPHRRDVTNFLDAAGSPMAFQPGPTWVILAPQGTRVRGSGG